MDLVIEWFKKDFNIQVKLSRWFDIIFDVISHMAVDIIKPSDPLFSSVPDKIKNDDRY